MFEFLKKEYVRRFERVKSPILQLTFDDQVFDTVDWSLGGCRIKNYKGKRIDGSEVHIESVLGAKQHFQAKFTAKVVRRNFLRKEIALQFDGFDHHTRVFLKSLLPEELTRISGPTSDNVRFGGGKKFGRRS